MALIDVNELLDDPDFCDSFTYARRVQGLDGNGRGTFTTTAGLPIVGSVQPASAADVLARFPDSARPSGWIRVYTATKLLAHDDVAHRYGDVLTWGGSQYQVRSVDEWVNYGASYTKVLAEQILAGAA